MECCNFGGTIYSKVPKALPYQIEVSSYRGKRVYTVPLFNVTTRLFRLPEFEVIDSCEQAELNALVIIRVEGIINTQAHVDRKLYYCDNI